MSWINQSDVHSYNHGRVRFIPDRRVDPNAAFFHECSENGNKTARPQVLLSGSMNAGRSWEHGPGRFTLSQVIQKAGWNISFHTAISAASGPAAGILSSGAREYFCPIRARLAGVVV
jgi:hypothetical protein